MKKTKIEIANPNELSVSVNPGCFNLAENGERKSTFEISNNNGFPLYFKLMASNSHAMKFQPECGSLGPYGSVTVTGYHVQSARPIGLQQKVAIMTSRLPLEEWPDQDHYKLESFSSIPQKPRSPSKSLVPPIPSPHFDRYEHEILRTARRHGDTVSSTTGTRTVRTPERRIVTTIERPVGHTPERQAVPTIERRQMVPTPDRRMMDLTTEERTMVSATERRTVPVPDRQTTVPTTERRTPQRRNMDFNAERRMMMPDTESHHTRERRAERLSSEEQERHVRRREGGHKDRGDIRTKRLDVFCHCKNCKGPSVKMKDDRRTEGKGRWEIVKQSCQRQPGNSSDETDSVYQNTVTLELEQLPTSSSDSYGSCLSSENSCLIEKFNTMIQECNKILTLTQYNFLLILLLLLVLIISSRNVVFSYLWPQPFCYKYPWFAHYFGVR